MNAHLAAPAPALPRTLGLLPIAFVCWAYTNYDHPAHLLWMCNLCNLLVAVGLLTNNLRVIWLGTLWLILGFPLWIVDIFVKDQFYSHSFFTHAVTTFIGLWAIRGRPARPRTWMLAWVFGVSVQAICRLWTPPSENINVAHSTYAAFSGWLNNYFVYWFITVSFFAVALSLTERGVTRFVALRPG